MGGVPEMDIHHLRIFCEVYRRQSFSQASQHCNVTQPTVSAHIKSLEQELDCRLFDRLGQKILPTTEANALYPLACRVLDALGQLEEELALVKKEMKGQIVIGASTIPGTYILPPIMARFRKEHPEVSFEIRVADSRQVIDAVLCHEIFLGIVGTRTDDAAVSWQELCTDDLILAANRQLWKRFASLPAGRILTEIPFLLRESGSGTRRTMERYLAELRLSPDQLHVVAVLGSTASIREALKSGLGASILSRLAISEELARGELFEIPLPGLPMRRQFYLVSHAKRSLPNLYRTLAAFLARTAAGGGAQAGNHACTPPATRAREARAGKA